MKIEKFDCVCVNDGEEMNNNPGISCVIDDTHRINTCCPRVGRRTEIVKELSLTFLSRAKARVSNPCIG